MISALFDAAANSYDESFTYTAIGKLQRYRVWKYLESVLPKNPLNILELNCGTGEDAIWFAKNGHNVLATDISENMIVTARSKANKLELSNRISFKQLDIKDIGNLSLSGKFDLIFSNFGGFNCLNEIELKQLSNNIHILLKPNGKFIAVVMPTYCIIESVYFLMKFKLKKAFRRNKVQSVNIAGSLINTYYYNPKKFFNFFSNTFILNKIIAVGFFIPPSYLNSYFKRKAKTLKLLNKLESAFGNNSITASVSDHYLIDLNLKK